MLLTCGLPRDAALRPACAARLVAEFRFALANCNPARAGFYSEVGIPLADYLIQSGPGLFTPRVTCRAA